MLHRTCCRACIVWARKHCNSDWRAHLRARSALRVHVVGKVHGFLLPAEALEHMRMPVLSCFCHSTSLFKVMVSLQLRAFVSPNISGA